VVVRSRLIASNLLRRLLRPIFAVTGDETNSRRGHRYVTNILDAEKSRLLLKVEGRSAEALRAFANALAEHGGDPSQIEAIAMDMSPAYSKGALSALPDSG
jgi:transposase